MGTAIRKHIKDFLAIVALVVIAGGITLYVLVNQNLNAPDWVPVLGKDTFTLKAQFSTAQAVTPGQGQSVNIAGVPVGQVTNAELQDGRAIVTMEMESKYQGRIFPNATMLLRPKTGLKDMIIALDPGSPEGGTALGDGATLPISRTAPDVNFEEFLSVLDADTRDYLTLLINGGGQGLAGNGRTLAQVFRELDPFQRNIAKINRYLRTRQQNLKHVTTSLSLLLNELGSRDTQLAAFVDSSNNAFKNFVAQKQNIKDTITLLPAALAATNSAMKSLDSTAQVAGPTLKALLPTAEGLAPLQIASQQFFKGTQAAINGTLYDFATNADVRSSLKGLEGVAVNVNRASPGLQKFGESSNYAVNLLKPAIPGQYVNDSEVPPYLFNLFWLGHDTNASILNQDAAGPVRQSVFLASKASFQGAALIMGNICAPSGNADLGSPVAWSTLELLRYPRPAEVAPSVCAGPATP